MTGCSVCAPCCPADAPHRRFAQWPPHPTSRVPKNGQWRARSRRAGATHGRRQARLHRRLAGLGTPAAARPQAAPGAPPPRGVCERRAEHQGRPAYPPESAALAEQRRADNSKDNPEATCLPMGIMQFHTQGAPRKFIQTPDVLVILYEASIGIRQIFTDGRPLPNNDPQPWWYGYSVGRWEGDTLVVETKGLRDDGWLDIFGTPLTDAAKYHGALSPRELRAHGDRRHRRRPESLHGAMDGARQSANHARAGIARVRLQREQPLLRATLTGGAPCATPTATLGLPSWHSRVVPLRRASPRRPDERPRRAGATGGEPACPSRPTARRAKRFASPLRVPTDRARLWRAADPLRRAPRR